MRAQQRWTTAWYQRTPSEGQRVRVLIEGPDTAWFEEFTQYRAHGYEVAVCTGPGPTGDGCTLLTEGCCPLADEADVVLSALDLEHPACRQLVDDMARNHPERPLIVDGSNGDPSVGARVAQIASALSG